MVPDGWKWKKLGAVAELQRGFDLPKASRIEGSVPIISSGGTSGYHNEHKAEAPGVVTGRYGSIGDVFFIEENFWPLNTSLWVKNFHGNHAKFIYYLLSKFDFAKFSDKTGVPGVNRNDLHAVKVGVPPLPEQKKIAQILSTWDQAITATERLLENSQQRKKGLMQQLLTGKRRLLSDDGTPFRGDWQQKSIEDYFRVGSSKRVLQNDWKAEGIPFYRTRELVSLSKRQPFRSEIFISEALFRELSQKYGAPAPRDFLVSGVGTLGIGYRVKEGDQFYFKDGNVLWLKPKDGIDSVFFEYCFQHEYIQNQIVSQASITTVGTYTIQNAKKTRFYCPPTFEEQQKVARVLLTADHEIDCLYRRLKQLKNEKRALMQQLLTGKRRVQVETEAA